MENGSSPCDMARHVEQTLIDENGKPWSPRNASKKRYAWEEDTHTEDASTDLKKQVGRLSKINS